MHLPDSEPIKSVLPSVGLCVADALTQEVAMRLPLLLIASILGLVLVDAPTFAQGVDPYGDAVYDQAEVVRVDPIIRQVEQPMYQQECWDQPVTYREPPRYVRHNGPGAPAVLGAIVGGVIGNQFGHGSGRAASTAFGAMLGHEMVRDTQGGYYRDGREYTRYERRCQPRTDYRRDEQVTGYDVTYRYRGRLYHTVTDYPPGPTLTVRLDVSPVR